LIENYTLVIMDLLKFNIKSLIHNSFSIQNVKIGLYHFHWTSQTRSQRR